MQHSIADTVALAPIAWVFQQTQGRILLRKLPYDLGGIVAGTIVHDDDLRVGLLLANIVEDALQRSSDPRALVVRRNDETVSTI